MPCTPNPEESKSPRMEAPELLQGKYAKKFGDCQWVMPGRISFSTSLSMASKGSPLTGGVAGNKPQIATGFTRDNTGNDLIRWKYSASQSTTSWSRRRNSSGVILKLFSDGMTPPFFFEAIWLLC